MHRLQASLIFLIFGYVLALDLASQHPLPTVLNPISPIYYVPPRDAIAAREKSGIYVGAGIGLPASSMQSIHGIQFAKTLSYGYRVSLGYQDYLQVLSFFPKGIWGARIGIEKDNTFHFRLENTLLVANSYLLNYDIMWDVGYFPNNNTIGPVFGIYAGATSLSGVQDYSLDLGVRFGVGFGFGYNNRLDIMYRVGKSGGLREDKFYFYSPYTIDIVYTKRMDFLKQQPVKQAPAFDSTEFLQRDK